MGRFGEEQRKGSQKKKPEEESGTTTFCFCFCPPLSLLLPKSPH
jgi:hypothetical protein